MVVIASSWHIHVVLLVSVLKTSLSLEICGDEQKFRNARSRAVHANKVRDSDKGHKQTLVTQRQGDYLERRVFISSIHYVQH